MEAVTMSYEYSHDVATMGPRQLAPPSFDNATSMSVYTNPGLAYATQFVSPAYMFNHSLPPPNQSYPQPYVLPMSTLKPPTIPSIQSLPYLQGIPRNDKSRAIASPSLKLEEGASSLSNSASPSDTSSSLGELILQSGETSEACGTEVDRVMKAIQAKPKPYSYGTPPPPSPPYRYHQADGVVDTLHVVIANNEYQGSYQDNYQSFLGSQEKSRSDWRPTRKEACPPRRKHLCPHEGCDKIFTQRTHLEIHKRAHSGEKPFHCSFPPCSASFSQLGNLRTHERRHTGERPFLCDLCDKSFAQRGNLRAHHVVHSNEPKPFICRLQECNKGFSQLGNLKAHMNRFHEVELRRLGEKFGDRVRLQNDMNGRMDMDVVDLEDEEVDLWIWFEKLFQHCNRGIKGRGKDRRVAKVKVERFESGVELPPLRHSTRGWEGQGNRSDALELPETY